MTPSVSITLERHFQRGALIGASLATLASAGALTVWGLEVARLRQAPGALSTINPVGAVLLLFAAGALFLRANPAHSPRRLWSARVLAFLVLEVALLRLQELATGWNAGLDHTLYPADLMRHTARLTPLAALALLGHGLALLTMDRSRRGWWASQLASCLAFGVALLALSAHAFGASGAHAAWIGLMAPQVAAAHAMLALAMLAVRPRGAVTGAALDEGPAGRVLRRALPLTTLLPFVAGGAVVLGLMAGAYSPAHGVALAVAVCGLLLAATAWLGARARIRAEEARRGLEQELAQSRRRLEFAVDAARIGTWEWDLASDVVKANRTLHEMWGSSGDSPLPMQRYLERVHPEDAPKVQVAMNAARDHGADYRQTFRVVLPDGTVRVLGARGRTLRDDGGRAVLMHGVHWDTTAEHEAGQLLEREWQREMEQREAFLSHVSQELRSPLATVIEFVGILRGGIAGTLTREQADYLEIASRNAASLKTMIDDLLDATRAQTGKLTVQCRRVAIHPLVSETLSSLQGRASRKGVSIELDSRFTVNDVQADPHRVVQILVNFVDNAVKFTPQGGAIRVSAEASTDRTFVVLSVADSGCGIAAENRDRIFDRLQVEKTAENAPRGLGLGLSICRQLTQLMGGRIWLESQLGQGSTFHLELPVWSRRPALARIANRCVPGEPLAIITAEVSTPDGLALGMEKESALLEAFRVTGTCVLPDKDVLLPREGPADDRESYHLLARTHLDGAEVLRARVEGELGASAELRASGLRHRVVVTPLPAFQPEAGADIVEYLDGLVAGSLAEQHLHDRDAA